MTPEERARAVVVLIEAAGLAHSATAGGRAIAAAIREAVAEGGGELFWVAELVDPVTGLPFTPAVYWCGDTQPVFVPVTTIDIQGALKFRDAAACQAQIDRCGPCKRGVLRPMEHAWAADEKETP